MGRQFQVYLLPSDTLKLINLLRHEFELHTLTSRMIEPQLTEAVPILRTEDHFTRVDCLLVPNSSAEIKLDYLERQKLWSINTLFSEVVEFSGCHFGEETLKTRPFFLR